MPRKTTKKSTTTKRATRTTKAIKAIKAKSKSAKAKGAKLRRGTQGLSNLSVRILTAVVAGPVLIALLYVVPWWGFFALVLAAAGVAAFELASMVLPDHRLQRGWAVAATIALLCAIVFVPAPGMTLAVAVLVTGLIAALVEPEPLATAALRAGWLVVTPLYAGGLCACFVLLHRLEHGGSWVLLVMLTAWFGDSGAYFAGRFLGSRKLYPKVSPNKTVEGAIGGLAASMAGAVAVGLFLPIPVAHAVLLGFVGGAAGQLGDLTISLLKRSAKVKDTGFIVPGHGGLLDRIDGLVFVAATVWVYAAWVL